MKRPIYTEFNLDAKVGNPKPIAITHTDDQNADVLEVNVRQNGAHIDLTGADVIARMVLHKDRDYLLSDSVPCAVSDSGNILIPFDNAVIPVQKGDIKIEVSLTQADSVLTLQFPLRVSVNGSVLDDAEVTPESKGKIPDLLKEAADALKQLGSYSNLEDKPQINGVTLDGDQTPAELGLQKTLTAGQYININPVDGTISGFEVAGWKIKAIDNCIEDGVLYSTSINNQAAYVLARNITTIITQYAFFLDGRVMWRTRQAETAWQPAEEWSAWEEIGGDYNRLSNKPQISFSGQSVTLNGALNFYFGDFTGQVLPNGVMISLRENVFKSSLSPTNNIPYNFNAIASNLLLTGVLKIQKVDVTNLPQEFTDAGSTIYVYHYVSNKTYSNLIRMVTYETADGVKMWIQLVTLGGMDASDNVQVTNQTAWVELTGTPKEDISGAVVTLNQSVYTYDGTSKAPSVTSVVLNGQTLTAGTDYAVIANPATNAGQYVVVVNGMGDYKGTVTTAWEIAKAQATISGDDSITITGIDDPVTKTYTTDGDGAFSFAITGNIATVANIGGEVTITPTALGSATMTVTLSEGANYLGATKTVPVEIVNSVTVFGVVWDYSLSSPQLARLTPQTDPLGVVTTVPSQEPTACVGNDGNGQSDFDNYMPWAGMVRKNYVNGQVVDFTGYDNGETYVFIPEFWSKIVDDSTNSKMYIYSSPDELTGFTKHLGSGRYIGRYKCSGLLKSKPGGMSLSQTMNNFRTGLRNADANYYLCDIHTYNAIQLLYLVEFADFNIRGKIGVGITSGSSQNNGGTDTLTYHTGRSSGTENLSAVQYRWIENLYGNVWEFIDGVIINGNLVYICSDPSKYAGALTSDYISTELYLPEGIDFVKKLHGYENCYLFPKEHGGSESTYICAKSSSNDSRIASLRIGGSFDSAEVFGSGLFSSSTDGFTYGAANRGARQILILGGDSQ